VGDTCALHFESFQRPVPSRDRAHETGGDVVPLKLESVEGVKFVGARGLFQDFVDRGFEVGVKGFKEVFEEECE
jgi:hypothetical protein